MSVTNVSNGSINGIETKQIPNGDSPTTEDEDIRQLESDLPLVGDYIGIGGPDAVPLESQGAFEKPEKVADSLLDDLFMSPTDIQLISRRRTLLNADISQNKSRLKSSIIIHCLLFVVMVLKLLPEVLDKLDIFILEIEELLIPKPQLWEWIWASSVIPAVFALSACKKSKAFDMKIFQALNIATGVLPVMLGMSYHFWDFYEVLTGSSDDDISKWMNVPTAILWYAFFFVASQLHIIEIYLSKTLIDAWTRKKTN